MLRGTLLFLSEQPTLKHMLRGPLTRPLIHRFVAGETLAEATETARQINADGMTVAFDYLGESVGTAAEAGAAVAQYVAILHAIERAGIRAYASLKPTQMGLDVGYDLCLRNLSWLVAQAAQFGTFVRLDMESSAYTDATLRLVTELRQRYNNVGVVIQAYLFRSEADIRELNARGISVRLCKGAYNEPPEVAFPQKADTDANYIRLMQILLAEGNDPAIATHDERMISATCDYATKQGIPRDRFEFQMLYGIRRDLQRQLTRDGYRVRVYMPYGGEWYPYLMRRMAERPANMLFVLSGVLRDLR
ncbi:MAG TPA: proline dehydrogenase family protein [Roseiflexaceae bacterium]|nr:proline dehydrogenase family protein [Roseiflexaceae bacterium]